MERNEQAALFLEQLTPARLAVVEEMAFRSQLQKIRFDYSLASLGAVDRLLAELRTTMKLERGAFLQKRPAVHFVAVLSFYLGATIARAGGFAIRWLAHEEVQRYMPGVPWQIETDTGCVIGDAVVFPATVVLEGLFAAEPQRTCQDFARRLVERLKREGQGGAAGG